MRATALAFWTVYFAGMLVALIAGGPVGFLLWWAGFPILAATGAAATIAVAQMIAEAEAPRGGAGDTRLVEQVTGRRSVGPEASVDASAPDAPSSIVARLDATRIRTRAPRSV